MEFMEAAKPFYRTAGKGKFYEQEEPVIRDKIFMRSYYPKDAGYVQSFVDDACDRLDYEGSFIYDEYPDRESIERVCQSICRQMEESREMESMQRRRKRGDGGFLEDLVGALLCNEIHGRRCRRRRFHGLF